MDERELAGRLLMMGVPGPDLDSQTGALLSELHPGGIILFKRNFDGVDRLRRLTRDLHALPSRPLIAIDHEGGAVTRLTSPFTHFPAARVIARAGDPALTYAVGHAMGTELASVGIDIDFAPVLDVNTNPANPIIGERAFGTTAQDVISHALPFMRGLLDAGVLPCGKHFPGHGDTDRDSHLQLPVVARSRNQLNQIELPPFCAAIESGIPMLMTAHVLYPCLDEHNPATLSRTILDSLLREEMGFDGVLVSDDLEMRAVSADQSVPDLSVRSLQAGVDWLLICNDPEAAVLAARRIRDAVREGTIDASAASAAAERIDRLRTRLTARRTGELPFPEHASLNAQVRALAGAAGA